METYRACMFHVLLCWLKLLAHYVVLTTNDIVISSRELIAVVVAGFLIGAHGHVVHASHRHWLGLGWSLTITGIIVIRIWDRIEIVPSRIWRWWLWRRCLRVTALFILLHNLNNIVLALEQKCRPERIILPEVYLITCILVRVHDLQTHNLRRRIKTQADRIPLLEW